MAASGSAGNSKQKGKGSASQNEQGTMDHFLHQALLLNAAWQVCTDSFAQASKKQGELYPTVRFFSTTANKWTQRLLNCHQCLAKSTPDLNTLSFPVPSKSFSQNLAPLSLKGLVIYVKKWQKQQENIELAWANPILSLAAVVPSFHIKYSWVCRQSQPRIMGESPTPLCPDRQRNTAMPSMPVAPLTQEPLSESGWCQMSQGTGALRIVQEKAPGRQEYSAVTFLRNRGTSCRPRCKTKKHRLMADHRNWEKSLWICSIWYTPRTYSSWRSLGSPRFRELNLGAAV